MNQQSKRVALPAYLRRRLQAFHVGQGTQQSFFIKDQATDKTIQLEPWQFFILEILPGCDNFQKLESIFEDRFGQPITQDKVDELFFMVAGNGLFGIEASSHPMLSSYASKKRFGAEVNMQEKTVQGAISVIKNSGPTETPHLRVASSPGNKADANTNKQSIGPEAGDLELLPAGVQGVFGFDEAVTKRRLVWKFFDPRPLLKLIQPTLMPFRYAVYLLPFLFISALFTAIGHVDLIKVDIATLHRVTTFFSHALFSMFTINLLVTLSTAIVAYTYRATVSEICIVLMMGFLPRFMVRVRNTVQLSRRERMWLHGTPILVRAGLFSIGILIWFNSRTMNGLLPQISLALAGLCALDLVFFTTNPLLKGSGYHLLCTFLDEPNLRAKSYKALMNRIRGNTYSKAESSVLAAFALASISFMLLAVVVIVFFFYSWLNVQIGGGSIVVLVLLGIYLIRRMIAKFKKIEQAYNRSVQFDRWRKRTLSEEEKAGVEVKETSSSLTSYIKKALPFTLLIILFLPYSYEPGGTFIISSVTQQNLTTDIDGTIAEVNFDGGEELNKGTVIARLATDDYQNQVNIYNARMREQQSVIDDLKSLPKPEEVALEESELKVATTQEQFSKGKADRSRKLYADGAISFEELDKAARENQVDISQVAQKRAKLALVKAGVTPDVIAAAEGKLESFKEERDLYQDRIDRSYIRMPFDGVLVGTQLRQKIGSFLEKGKQFAIVEQTDTAVAEIDIAESDIGYVSNVAKVVVRPEAYPNVDFTGTVFQIDKNVTSQSSGKIVKVYTMLDNRNGRLKAGMTGYGKIDGGTMPVWKAFSLAIFRFIQVELWSWIP